MRVRYRAILLRFFTNSLIRDMGFRGHFILNVVTQLLWIGMLIIFIKIIFANTAHVSDWNENQYLFLVGTHLMLTSIFETLFFDNCWRVSELVRSGDLDFVLLRPANTQFLLSFERINYAAFFNFPVAVVICVVAVVQEGRGVSAGQVALFAALIVVGITTLYALMFMFAVTSVWLIRQTGLEQLWFYTVSLARYPAEIYQNFAGGALHFALVFVLPVLLVSNLPANVVMRAFDRNLVIYFAFLSLVLLGLSSVVFKLALRWYRSASS